MDRDRQKEYLGLREVKAPAGQVALIPPISTQMASPGVNPCLVRARFKYPTAWGAGRHLEVSDGCNLDIFHPACDWSAFKV